MIFLRIFIFSRKTIVILWPSWDSYAAVTPFFVVQCDNSQLSELTTIEEGGNKIVGLLCSESGAFTDDLQTSGLQTSKKFSLNSSSWIMNTTN